MDIYASQYLSFIKLEAFNRNYEWIILNRMSGNNSTIVDSASIVDGTSIVDITIGCVVNSATDFVVNNPVIIDSAVIVNSEFVVNGPTSNTFVKQS